MGLDFAHSAESWFVSHVWISVAGDHSVCAGGQVTGIAFISRELNKSVGSRQCWACNTYNEQNGRLRAFSTYIYMHPYAISLHIAAYPADTARSGCSDSVDLAV